MRTSQHTVLPVVVTIFLSLFMCDGVAQIPSVLGRNGRSLNLDLGKYVIKSGRLKRSLGHRSKRHHPYMLRSALGDLQNYVLVPVQSSNGQTSYIMVKNPKFEVVNSSSTAAPKVIQIAGQSPAPSTSGGNPGVVKPVRTSAHIDYQVAGPNNLPTRPIQNIIPQRTGSKTAASSAAASSGNSAVVMNVPPSVGLDPASVATSSYTGSSASAARVSNYSVELMKTIKKTTFTKTKLADQTGTALVLDSVPVGVLSDKSGQSSITAPGRPAKNTILSENNDVRAAKKQAVLISTYAPKVAAKMVNTSGGKAQKRRRKQNKKRTETQKTPTTAEIEQMEVEAEEKAPKATPSFFGLAPHYIATQAPPGVAGWAGPTTEPALGLLDRINTTDVPEEIEPLPDKTPREQRAELLKRCLERVYNFGQMVDCNVVAEQQYQQQKQRREEQLRRQRQRQQQQQKQQREEQLRRQRQQQKQRREEQLRRQRQQQQQQQRQQQTPQLQKPHVQQQPGVAQQQPSKRKTKQLKTKI